MTEFSEATLRQEYEARGFVTPLHACSADDAAAALREATGLEGDARFKPHLYLPAINRVARAPAVVAAARACLGGDVFLWSSDVNFKGPHSEAFFSPHQDSTYAGLAPAERCCTIWVALTAADEASGALAFASASHLQGQRPHVENDGRAGWGRGPTLRKCHLLLLGGHGQLSSGRGRQQGRSSTA